MQAAPSPYLARRIRRYQSLLDSTYLRKDDKDHVLPDSYIIFICNFDPTGNARMRTTILDWALEDEAPYPMGRCAILLSSKGQGDEDSKLKAFLKYVGGATPQDTDEWDFTN